MLTKGFVIVYILGFKMWFIIPPKQLGNIRDTIEYTEKKEEYMGKLTNS